MFEAEIERSARDLRSEAEVDFFDISMIAEPLRERLGLRNQDEIRHYSLSVIARLMMLDVYPGDYDYAAKIKFWIGEPSDLIKRIESEWIAIGHTPNLEKSICWFGLRLSNSG